MQICKSSPAASVHAPRGSADKEDVWSQWYDDAQRDGLKGREALVAAAAVHALDELCSPSAMKSPSPVAAVGYSPIESNHAKTITDGDTRTQQILAFDYCCNRVWLWQACHDVNVQIEICGDALQRHYSDRIMSSCKCYGYLSSKVE